MLRITASAIQDREIITHDTAALHWKEELEELVELNNIKGTKKVGRPKRRISGQGQVMDERDALIRTRILQGNKDRYLAKQRIKEEEQRVKDAEKLVREEAERLVVQKQKEKEAEERRLREIERKGFQIPGLWSDEYSEQWFWFSE